MEKPTFVLILGVHRSGTSALTGVFNKLGISAGKHLMKPNADNERGFFELSSVYQVLESLLVGLGRSWCDPRPLPEGWLDTEIASEAYAKLKAIFLDEYDLTELNSLKDPRVCRVLPLIERVLVELEIKPVFVFSLRHPADVIASLAKRDGLDPVDCALLYLRYLLDAERATRNLPRVFVDYEDLLNDWRCVFGKIESSLGVSLIPTHEGHEKLTQDADEFLTRALNHAPSRVEVEGGSPLMGLARGLFEILRGGTSGVSLDSVDRIADQFLDYFNVINPWLSRSIDFSSALSKVLVFEPSPQLNAVAGENALSVMYFAYDDMQLSEDKTLKMSWSYGSLLRQRYTFSALENKLRVLRWDLTDRHAYCAIRGLEIESPDGSVVWRWNMKSPLFSNCSRDLHVLGVNSEGALEVYCSGGDPHGFLVIPDDVLARFDDGWAITVWWSAKLPFEATMPLIERMRSAVALLGGSMVGTLR